MDPQKKVQNYRKLIEITRDLAGMLDLDILLQRIIQAARELVRAEASSILLYDQANERLYFQAASDPENEKQMRGIVVPTGSIAGWVALNRQILIVDNVHQDNRFFEKVEKTLDFHTRSMIAVPMIANDRLIGVLEVLNKVDGIYTPDDEENLTVLGAQAAVAIENSRLFQQSDLISELVHELRTPLSSISTISYLLQRPEISQEQRLDLAKTIYTETHRLNAMTSSFLDIARLESGRFSFQWTKLDVLPLLEECCDLNRLKAHERGITIRLDSPPGLPVVDGDRDKIRQVILNLLSNAIKYNRENGSIVVKINTESNALRISVKDTGYGIAAAEIHRVFSKFYRGGKSEKSTTGTGLGLSICKRIIEGHKGQISMESTEGVGTTFSILLPLKQEA